MRDRRHKETPDRRGGEAQLSTTLDATDVRLGVSEASHLVWVRVRVRVGVRVRGGAKPKGACGVTDPSVRVVALVALDDLEVLHLELRHLVRVRVGVRVRVRVSTWSCDTCARYQGAQTSASCWRSRGSCSHSPEHASGCPELRPASADPPFGPHPWRPATPGLARDMVRGVVHWDLEAHRDRSEILAHVLARILRDETAREQLRRAWVSSGVRG